MQTTLQALTAFLANTPANNRDLLDRWSADMETQINVVPGETRTEFGGWSDEFGNEWWPIRVPKQANSEPYYDDRPQSFSIEERAEAIGCTGWDWKHRLSRWVAFDFDSITGHAAGVGLSAESLAEVQRAACDLPWVEVRRSTSGRGLHLYVFLAEPVETNNHNEHAALGRAILGLMSQSAGFNFSSAVDCAGGNIWIWSRRATPENQGLALIREGEPLTKIPDNWRAHIDVVTRKRSKIRVVTEGESDFEQLSNSRRTTPLDREHHKLINYLSESGYSTIWVQDYYLLQTHTCALKKAHEALKLVGLFDTISEGNNPGEPNCFCFANPNGAWEVYRFSPGTKEAPPWSQDGKSWTHCEFNAPPDFRTLARVYGGLRLEKAGQYQFETLANAAKAVEHLGVVALAPDEWLDRQTIVKVTGDREIVLQVERQLMAVEEALERGILEVNKNGRLTGKTPPEELPEGTVGWVADGKKWIRVIETTVSTVKEQDVPDLDDQIRSLIAPNGESTAGWVANTKTGGWVSHPKDDVRSVLLSLGLARAQTDFVFGDSIMNGWRLVNLPFQPEYPGNRQWNLHAPQFRFRPSETEYPQHEHWDLILEHCGAGLNDALKENEWASENGIRTGGEYLRLWIACMLREPFEPLPYLFFFGNQNCGKSIFHESIKSLVTRGVMPADRALTSSGDFNGELANAILCYIEEIDLSKAGTAVYNKIKDLVTSRTISIHEKHRQVYTQANMTHWVQCGNHRSNCPVFENDTRITMTHVPDIKKEIPKPILEKALLEEAPDFLRTLLDLHIPASVGRLRIPVIETGDKKQAQDSNSTELEVFLRENTHHVPGEKVLFSELFQKFQEYLPAFQRSYWSRTKVSRSLPSQHPTGVGGSNRTYIGNISFEPKEPGKPLTNKDGKLVVVE